MFYQKSFFAPLIATQLLFFAACGANAETVLKQETVSFKECLKVIEVTKTQTGLTPRMEVDEEALKVAEFIAPDGTVVIACDKEARQVTVSMK
jgi:hypothetical protein